MSDISGVRTYLSLAWQKAISLCTIRFPQSKSMAPWQQLQVHGGELELREYKYVDK